MPKVNFIISDELKYRLEKRTGIPELATLEFWRALMNHKYDKRIDIGGTYIVTETVIASDKHKEIVVFTINKKREAEIILAERDEDDSETLLRAMIKFHYVHNGGAFDGMKNGFEMRLMLDDGYNSIDFLNMYREDVELLKEAVKTVLTSPRFGLKNIYF